VGCGCCQAAASDEVLNLQASLEKYQRIFLTFLFSDRLYMRICLFMAGIPILRNYQIKVCLHVAPLSPNRTVLV
jgi:hypothetical protein